MPVNTSIAIFAACLTHIFFEIRQKPPHITSFETGDELDFLEAMFAIEVGHAPNPRESLVNTQGQMKADIWTHIANRFRDASSRFLKITFKHLACDGDALPGRSMIASCSSSKNPLSSR